MATMKNIDPKSLIIGVLATALVFACTDSNKKNSASPSLVTEAKAATSKDDRGKWDNEQEWLRTRYTNLKKVGLLTEVTIGKDADGDVVTAVKVTGGWEPFGIDGIYRKRIK